MNTEIKRIIAIASALLVAVAIYWGSYLPYEKSIAFIEALRSVRDAKSLAEFENKLTPALDAASPIGQEEIVRNTASVVLSLVQSNGKQPEITKEVISFLRNYFDPIIEKEKGMSFLQDTYVLGLIHTTAYDQTGKKEYLEQARYYFELSQQLGPDRPQALYGLFGIYRVTGQKDKAIEVGEKIVRMWPTDARTTALLQQLKASGT